MEPVTVFTAVAIAKIAFEELAKAGGGELAKKSLGGAIDLIKALRDKIRDTHFQGANGCGSSLKRRWQPSAHG